MFAEINKLAHCIANKGSQSNCSEDDYFMFLLILIQEGPQRHHMAAQRWNQPQNGKLNGICSSLFIDHKRLVTLQ